MIDSSGVPVLRATDAALAKVLELRADEDQEESLALWVEISGSSGGSYTYEMYFQTTSDAQKEDWIHDQGGLALVVPIRPGRVTSLLSGRPKSPESTSRRCRSHRSNR